MDSLIVMRRILRKTQLEPAFINPKKPKKALPKLSPIPPDHNPSEPSISFVKLYKEVCVQNARRAACGPLHTPTRAHSATRAHLDLAAPTRAHTSRASREQLSVDWPGEELCASRRHVTSPASGSASSLLTQYGGRRAARRRLRSELPPSSIDRAELVLDLDYDITSKDSGFY